MADYIYLLENRLTGAQKAALKTVSELARSKGFTSFLVGGAVRDLTSGSPVRDLDLVVQGNALKLKKELEKLGASVVGEFEPGQALFLSFAGGVRMEVGSTLSVTYPKPGKAVMRAANILEDLRRRDFTANAMAISLNEGSYGLLMDPLNGVADIENRQLRLVSNYGFIEDPVKMIRAARLMGRLGWDMDEKTAARYETGKQEGYISVLTDYQRGYELEEIVHEEDPLRILKRLEAEGWMKHLAPYWSSQKVNVTELERMRGAQTQLQMNGIHPDSAAASFPLLTDKLSAKEVAQLKQLFPRQGFVAEMEGLEAESKAFAALLGGKAGQANSQAWKLLTSHKPEVVLLTLFSSKSPALQAKFTSFSQEWPQARQKMPYALMTEMRIVPELPDYEALLETLFFELMDGKLTTPEEMRAFLEPYSPPAPPPPQNLRRPRTAKKETKAAKSRAKKAVVPDDDEDELAGEPTHGSDGDVVSVEVSEDAPDDAPVRDEPVAVSPPVKVAEKKEAAKVVAPVKSATLKAAPVKAAPVKAIAAKAAPAKAAPVKAAKPAPAVKVVAKAATKAVKTAPVAAKKVAAKGSPAAKKTAVKAAVKTMPAKKSAAKTAPVAAKKSVLAGRGAPAKAIAVKSKSQPVVKAVVKKGAKR